MIRAACSPGEVRVAAEDGGRLIDVAIERAGSVHNVGDVHRGRVATRTPALGGAFVAIGGTEGFLPDTAGGTASEGSVLTVRITRAPQGGKGPRLAAIDEPASGPPGLLRRGPGAIERLAALHPDADILIDDPAVLAPLRPLHGARLHLVPRAFDDATDAGFDTLASRDIDLPGGGRMSIHPTPALVAIDLDLGAGSATSGAKHRTHEAANRAALPLLAAQIRLRNLAGPIVVDLAGMTTKKRASLGPAFAEALAADPLAPRFLGFSALGLAEILRPRLHPPLHELLAGPHAAGLAGLRALTRQAAAAPAMPLALHASPAITTALQADPAARADVQRLTGRPLILIEDRATQSWRVEAA